VAVERWQVAGGSDSWHPRIGGAALLALTLAFGAGCFSVTPHSSHTAAPAAARGSIQYVVRRGDTLYRISRVYGVSVANLMAVNHVSDPRNLRVGEVLTIPGAYREATSGQSGDVLASIWDVPRSPRQFAWPVWSGRLSSPFGMRHGAMHDGIDIAAPIGTPVHAAGSGVVIYVGRMNGYGNTVIIRHSGNYVTVYAHDEANFVHEGEHVARGQEIGEIGTSGHTTGANLHFEVRYDNIAHNPLSFLPPPAPAATGATFARNGPS
jgi:lipoprotein YgeR